MIDLNGRKKIVMKQKAAGKIFEVSSSAVFIMQIVKVGTSLLNLSIRGCIKTRGSFYATSHSELT
jgi:hypothetical protein